jgi:hypothetical protein
MDDLQILSRTRAGLDEPSEEVLREARQRLVARSERSRVVPLRRLPSMRRRVAVTAGLAAALAVGAVALSVATPHNRQGATPGRTVPASAGQLLNAAAIHTLRAGDPVIGPGQYRYVREHVWSGFVDDPTLPFFLSEQLYETWIPADERDRWYWRDTKGISARFFSPADEELIRTEHPDFLARVVALSTGTDGIADNNGFKHNTGSWELPTTAWLAKLPRDPDKLLARIHADHPTDSAIMVAKGFDEDDIAFDVISRVLRTGLVKADLRAALYRAAAKIPGIKLIDSTANIDGKRGVAIGLLNQTGDTRHDILFDAAGGQYIGDRYVVVRPGPEHVPAGEVYGSTAFTVSVADKPGFH